ncbi:GNAT family N-acetyltransferase [Kitasatospora sp. NPDC058170]|uniref:GNAT family N-acetyltransferase n=1 Tax=Kitasatospora sp. NPDC058170 TaxID=3346364 RepID=UPI0036DA7480
MTITYTWRGALDNTELDSLHAEGFGHPDQPVDLTSDHPAEQPVEQPVEQPFDWLARLTGHSLGWVCARRAGRLVGFVNVAWDGGSHAFLLDTVVATAAQRTGIGAELVTRAAAGAREAGCEWLHVDFEPHLRPFYLEACGFGPTEAGLLRL